jgi:hypothetical protein
MNRQKIAPMKQMFKVFTWMTLFFVILLKLMLVTAQASEVGYLGCSITEGAVKGALRQGETRLWTTIPYMTSGSLGGMVDGDKYGVFSSFKSVLAQYPVDTVWFNLCAGVGDEAFETYDTAAGIIDKIRALGVTTVYVSAPPKYTNPRNNYCRFAGESGQSRMEMIVAQLVANGYALKGPTLGPLDVARHTYDSCHGNQNGQGLMGKQLLKFGW